MPSAARYHPLRLHHASFGFPAVRCHMTSSTALHTRSTPRLHGLAEFCQNSFIFRKFQSRYRNLVLVWFRWVTRTRTQNVTGTNSVPSPLLHLHGILFYTTHHIVCVNNHAQDMHVWPGLAPRHHHKHHKNLGIGIGVDVVLVVLNHFCAGDCNGLASLPSKRAEK